MEPTDFFHENQKGVRASDFNSFIPKNPDGLIPIGGSFIFCGEYHPLGYFNPLEKKI
jgi:hypothetical protein